MIAWANHNGIKKGRSRLFSDDDLKYIESNYLTKTYSEIAQDIGYTESQVCGWINHNLEKKNRVFDDHYFDSVDSPQKAYWLGFIYADGYISAHARHGENTMSYEFGIELQRQDEYLLQLFNQDIGGVHKIYQRHRTMRIHKNKSITDSDTSFIRIYSKPFVYGLLKKWYMLQQNKT